MSAGLYAGAATPSLKTERKCANDVPLGVSERGFAVFWPVGARIQRMRQLFKAAGDHSSAG
jgi:hypothetical protein